MPLLNGYGAFLLDDLYGQTNLDWHPKRYGSGLATRRRCQIGRRWPGSYALAGRPCLTVAGL
jgi:hypothetical protein